MLDVDIKIKQGDFDLALRFSANNSVTGIFGPSGAGKSTLLRCIAGLATPDFGHISVSGKTVFDSVSNKNISPDKRKIGLVFQDNRLFPHMPVWKNMVYGCCRPERKRNSDSLLKIAKILDISHLLDRSVSKLSGGEAQRVAIGRAILPAPSLLLLDEPFGALSLKIKQNIILYLNRIQEETRIPMMIVSHAICDITQVTDMVLLVDEGRCVAHGKVSDLLKCNKTAQYFGSRNFVANHYGINTTNTCESQTKRVLKIHA